eukprot:5550315-Pyramimonas_sp.AAC.1
MNLASCGARKDQSLTMFFSWAKHVRAHALTKYYDPNTVLPASVVADLEIDMLSHDVEEQCRLMKKKTV